MTTTTFGHADHGDEGEHGHDAVNAGAVMVELGDHFAQLEVDVDGDAGALTLWFLDHGESIRLAQESLDVEVTVGDETFVVACAAQASGLTGETVGDSSEFTGTDTRLQGADDVRGMLKSADVKGATIEGAEFHWVDEEQGTEEEHE